MMNLSLLLLLSTFICFLIAGVLIWHRLRGRAGLAREPSFTDAVHRALTPEEQVAIENYLALSSHTQHLLLPSGSRILSSRLRLNAQSQTVISLSHAITRYGFSVDDTNQWRFYLNSTEIHLPPLWEQYINNNNDVELILTETLPLVISLNGHTLQDYSHETAQDMVSGQTAQPAFIRREESEPIDLLATRQETREEHAARQPGQRLPEAILTCIAFFILFLSILCPLVLLPWLVGSALILIAASLWGIYTSVTAPQLCEIHRLRGTPRRWGLFGESNHNQINNISLGIIDLTYPTHWKPYIDQDLGQKTQIDIYLDHHVVRHGAFLSLHDEVRHFPLQRWLHPLVIACGSLSVLLMMLMWVPLEMPLKLSLSWLSSAKTIEASKISDLEKYTLHVGDTLKISGTGVCHIPLPDGYTTHPRPAYFPFDCSQISWKASPPQSLTESETTRQALALTEAVKAQINPPTHGPNTRVNPQLASAIQQSGMVLLDDFSGIVQKTQALCQGENDCVRLKNALINLGNTKDWSALIRRANSGKLDGMNVLLRPVSAESLNNLVMTSTAPFFTREIFRTAESLNAPVAGGYIFVNNEGQDLVVNAIPQISLYDDPAQEQWTEFMNLAKTLSNIPFMAKGVISNIYTDAQGTQHVILQSISDVHSYWRYTLISLLLVAMLICFVVSSLIAMIRYRRDRQRLSAIQCYYDRCIESSAP